VRVVASALRPKQNPALPGRLGSLEGLLTPLVCRQPDSLPGVHGPEVERLVPYDDAAGGAAARTSDLNQNLVAEIVECERLDFKRAERFLDLAPVSEDPIVAAIDRRPNSSRAEEGTPLEIGSKVPEHGLHIVAAPGVIDTPHDLNVLLRHRAPSISRTPLLPMRWVSAATKRRDP
jgi:hypothetical protein